MSVEIELVHAYYTTLTCIHYDDAMMYYTLTQHFSEWVELHILENSSIYSKIPPYTRKFLHILGNSSIYSKFTQNATRPKNVQVGWRPQNRSVRHF